MSDYKSTVYERIAQHWFYSCDAPDTDFTAEEIQRLAKMIEQGIKGQDEIKWKIKNHTLKNLERPSKMKGFADSVSE